MREQVPAALAGERLDRIVAMLGDVSRSDAVRLIDAGAVRLDDAPATSVKVRLTEGQWIDIDVDALEPPAELTGDPDVQFTVVFADDDVIVVDKPVGLVVHPGGGVRTATLVHGLLARFPEIAAVGQPDRPGIVHRLDKGTSGLLVVARSNEAYDELVAALSAHEVERKYVAIVWGVPEVRRGLIDAPIGRSTRHRTRMAVAADGREARTRYVVLRDFGQPAPAAFVECALETGRTHQIRVHLSSIGHPVVGDVDYGGGRAALKVDRPMLHAVHLEFDHPVTGARMAFDSPLPADFAATLGAFSE
ncbi:MAG: RluA family pseudouridine synthase [Acidimicrobiia bacterium]